MEEKDIELQFKRILDFGYQKGNEAGISANQLIEELSEKLKILVHYERKED
ncbi:hypothetical protein MXL46_05900 [Heyndrickxia sporothermodurans]|uniref:Uncharacterized protein n=1 Tax=Heyndrickxia sporothermodurans TaxID=46224 RepID=A0A150L9R6_9BACI|nr:hypothetical protein [Heyndrickxia sporothermodurans]KYD09071.1 hypothetical protein B4102_2598 [Heyndrickxia sporothermodurans]MBL5767015.1 hypothetical protein [Heyndrickxia sporothermodurans]MBL5770483.1 hypothetical protein [Heyndrickxia sporothermodurans]MBL5774172.1 hypothetical protein [Heyndrickxia sporothermodurans]MBL5779095.1 hypothetical protein [Heyndrickxia sporothermodurans]